MSTTFSEYKYAGLSLIPIGHHSIGFLTDKVSSNISGPPAEATTNPDLSYRRYSTVISPFGSMAIVLIDDTVARTLTSPTLSEKFVVTVISER